MVSLAVSLLSMCPRMALSSITRVNIRYCIKEAYTTTNHHPQIIVYSYTYSYHLRIHLTSHSCTNPYTHYKMLCTVSVQNSKSVFLIQNCMTMLIKLNNPLASFIKPCTFSDPNLAGVLWCYTDVWPDASEGVESGSDF